MKLFKNIIAGFLAIAITFSSTVPAFAVDPGTIVGALQVAPDFGSWLWDTAKTGGNLLAGFIDNDNYCPGAETSLNGRHDFAPQHTQINGKTGMFYICQNCGKSAGEVLAPAYNDYVETLPAQGYNSSGGLLWSPSHGSSKAGFVRGSTSYVYCEHGEGKASGVVADRFTYSFNCSSNFISLMPISGSRIFSYQSSMGLPMIGVSVKRSVTKST